MCIRVYFSVCLPINRHRRRNAHRLTKSPERVLFLTGEASAGWVVVYLSFVASDQVFLMHFTFVLR